MKEVIKTKEQSKQKIVQSNVNRVPEIIVDKTDKSAMIAFFSEYTENLYVVRDAEHSSSVYRYVRTAEECLEKAMSFSGKVLVAVSVNAYQNKILLGAVEISEDNTVRICATTNSKYDHRTMYNGNAEFCFQTDIFDKRLSDIPEFDFVYAYIVGHRLHGYTVEFTVYDTPVGIKKEKIIINEIRNY